MGFVMLQVADLDCVAVDDSVFSELLASITPDEDSPVVLINCYFDESGDETLLCVAGYVFSSSKARIFDIKWRKMLQRANIPFFRMSACNAGSRPFDKMSGDEQIAIATKAINLIGEYAHFGVAVSIDQSAFDSVVGPKGVMSTAYEFCTWMCLVAASAEARKFFPYQGTSFFFEAGFRHQSQANRMMNNIFSSPELRAANGYRAHALVDKAGCRPAQAADLLAWQWYKDLNRRKNGKTKPRGDLTSLLSKVPHYAIHADEALLREMVRRLNEMAGIPYGSEMAGEAIRNPESPMFPKKPGEVGDEDAYKAFLAQFKSQS